MTSTTPDSTIGKALYTPTDINLPIPECKNDYISIEQDAQSVTNHADNNWLQTGTGAAGTAQTFTTAASKRLYLQNSSDPVAATPINQVRVPRSGVYKIVYSAQIAVVIDGGVTSAELGVGFRSTSGTPPALVDNTPPERILRLQPPSGQTSGTITDYVSGSVVYQLPAETVIRFYDRVLGAVADLTILNSDITIERLGRDGQ